MIIDPDSVAWAPQPGPQADAISAAWCPELFFGGARGGGKSDYLLGDFVTGVFEYGPNWQGVLFRRTYPELQELINRSHRIYPLLGGRWYEQAKEWHWENGACLRMRYLERDADASRYQGHQYTWIGWDELTQWPSDTAYNLLKACLRWAEADVPTKRIRASGNPGGPGHQWVKSYFIDHAPGGYLPLRDLKTGMERMFIPSRVGDNQILLRRDPGYTARLEGVGSPALVKAWLEGDWSIVAGAYFADVFGLQNIVRPFEIKPHWTKFRSFDWGSAKPFCSLWNAIASEDTEHAAKGSLIVYREWYGCSKPNVGLGMLAVDVGRGIASRTPKTEQITYSVADPAIFIADGGPSIAEQMRPGGVSFRPADNSRQAGWQQIRARAKGYDDKPRLLVFDTCTHLIRTLPTLQHDSDNPEDLDSEGEDHAADTLRYGAMSRPWLTPTPAAAMPLVNVNPTWDDLFAEVNRSRKVSSRI